MSDFSCIADSRYGSMCSGECFESLGCQMKGMKMYTATIKPGCLISIKTTCHGGVQYNRVDMGLEYDGNGQEISEWQTTRVIEDKTEHERSVQVRAKCSNILRLACISTPFGSICPEEKIDEFMVIYENARKLAEEFNESAQNIRITINMMRGRIASDDQEAVRSMISEMRELAQAMDTAISSGDVKAIREAAGMALRMGAMLDESVGDRISEAVKAARKAAREIVKRVEKKGEKLEEVVNEQNTQPIDQMRVAFLDLEMSLETSDEPAMPAVDLQRVAGLEL